MKLFRFGQPGEERTGLILEDGRRVDVTTQVPVLDGAYLGGGGLGRLRGFLREPGAELPPVAAGVRMAAPVAEVGKIVCVGMNYAAHAREFMDREPPREPVLFMKANSALCGPEDDLAVPPGAEKLDYELELAVVIGRRACRVGQDAALDHVAGYTMINDVSERAWQKEHEGQWTKGKSHDGFAPLGPCLVTPDELEDPGALGLWLDVNGESRQRGNTSDMIFPVPFLISYISRFMTLEPGDVIATGTPAGVAMGMDPPAWLKPGDLIEMGIDGIGCSRRKVVAMDLSPEARPS
jgi:2,4-didehydro-3-deoxy-L-rhamnonate hydrolase